MLEFINEKVVYLVAGALLAWLLQQYRVLRAEDLALVNDHIKDLEKFRDAAQSYWLEIPDKPDKEQAAAAKVRAALAAITRGQEQVEKICGVSHTQYSDLILELFTSATGGNFESARTEINPIQAIEIADITARLIIFLRTVRRDVLSLTRIVPEGVRNFGA